MVHFWIPPLLARAAPDTQVLVLLRDPVERYRSGLGHNLRSVNPKRLEAHHPRLSSEAFGRGFYAAQLELLERHVDPARILVQQYERCTVDIAGELKRTCAFLGLDAGAVGEPAPQRVNPTREAKPPVPDAVRTQLVDLYGPDVERLARRYPDLDVGLWPNFAGRV
jgi:hypothetical protein